MYMRCVVRLWNDFESHWASIEPDTAINVTVLGFRGFRVLAAWRANQIFIYLYIGLYWPLLAFIGVYWEIIGLYWHLLAFIGLYCMWRYCYA